MGKRKPKPQHTTAYIELRTQLKSMRLTAGLTQSQLAEAFKRHHTFIHKIESGDRRIDPVEFCTWCKACSVKPSTAIDPVAKSAP